MSQSAEAICEDGVLRPLRPLNLQKHARVRIVIETEEEVQARVQAMMDLDHRVYEGFSDSEIAEIETIALGRSRWSTGQPYPCLYTIVQDIYHGRKIERDFYPYKRAL